MLFAQLAKKTIAVEKSCGKLKKRNKIARNFQTRKSREHTGGVLLDACAHNVELSLRVRQRCFVSPPLACKLPTQGENLLVVAAVRDNSNETSGAPSPQRK